MCLLLWSLSSDIYYLIFTERNVWIWQEEMFGCDRKKCLDVIGIYVRICSKYSDLLVLMYNLWCAYSSDLLVLTCILWVSRIETVRLWHLVGLVETIRLWHLWVGQKRLSGFGTWVGRGETISLWHLEEDRMTGIKITVAAICKILWEMWNILQHFCCCCQGWSRAEWQGNMKDLENQWSLVSERRRKGQKAGHGWIHIKEDVLVMQMSTLA